MIKRETQAERRRRLAMEEELARKRRRKWLIPPIILACGILIVLLFPRNDKNQDTAAYLKTEHSAMALQEQKPEDTKPVAEVFSMLAGEKDNTVLEKLGKHVLVIPKQNGRTLVSVDNDYVHKKFQMILEEQDTLQPGTLQGVMNDALVTGIDNMTDAQGERIFDTYEIRDITSEQGTEQTAFTLTLLQIYDYRLYEDASYYYIDLYRPRELYDKIVVVDAGHGGADMGALSQDKTVKEKDLNLAYVLEFQKLVQDEESIGFYYTRLSDPNCSEDYSEGLRLRTELVNDIGADLFLSVHFNSNEIGNQRGTQAYYNAEQDDRSVSSKKFAELLLNNMENETELKKGSVHDGSTTISVVKYSEATVVLLEVGYINNQEDLQLITAEETRKGTAKAMYETILQMFEALQKQSETEVPSDTAAPTDSKDLKEEPTA